jgi:hypothetical protein
MHKTKLNSYTPKGSDDGAQRSGSMDVWTLSVILYKLTSITAQQVILTRALSKGPNRADVSLISPEAGNRSSFPNDVFLVI